MMKELCAMVIVATGMLVVPTVSADCVPVKQEERDYRDDALRVAKIQNAVAVIGNPEYLSNDQACVVAAIRYLGVHRVKSAIPRLVELLSYRVEPEEPLQSKPTVGRIYPAMGALFQIGNDALPSLIKVIADRDNEDVSSKNALFTLMSIYHSKGKGVRALTEASTKQTDPQAAVHLERAAEEARSTWCKDEVQCSDETN